MVNPTPPLSPSPITQITARQIGQSNAIVTVNGARYEFTVCRNGMNITDQFNWQKTIAPEAIRIALSLAGKNTIETASVFLTGIPEDFDSPASPHARPVTLLSAIVQESPRVQERQFNGDCIDHAVQPKINQCLSNIGNTFARGSTMPLSPQEQHLQPHQRGLWVYPVLEGRLHQSIAYQGMKKAHGANFEPSEDQLREMAEKLRRSVSVPDVNLDSDPTTFLDRLAQIPGSPKFAVVGNQGITHCSPANEQINFNDWMFIHLDNDSWNIIDMERSQEILEEWVRIKNANSGQEGLLAAHLSELLSP